MTSFRQFPLLLTLCGILTITGCSSSDDAEVPEEEKYANESAEALYTMARANYAEQDYNEAIELFDEVERQYPYSEWAARSQIMAGYIHYERQRYDDAVLAFERFVKLHPGHESTPYAYYIMALSHYEQISDVGRDQGMTKKAMDALREVVKRFPNTEYARDARLKLDLTEDHLAGKEMMVGRYYLEREEYLAAVNRFRHVIDVYQTTSHVPEALHRLVETYLKLGVHDEARRYAAVLGHNFPGSEWYRYSYALLEDASVLPPSDDDSSMWDWF